MKNGKIAILLGTMCFLLTLGIFIQVKTTKESGVTARTRRERTLLDNARKMEEKADKQEKISDSKDKELNNLMASASVNDSSSSELFERLNEINSQIGLTSLQGEGIIVKIEDGEENPNIPTVKTVVHDSDLKAIVNELCIAGAEAISINGQRIVSTTAITCVGNVIKINDEKVGSPFEISAIGRKAELDGNISMNGRTISLMKKAGISVKITRSDSVVIPKYDGIFTTNYINK